MQPEPKGGGSTRLQNVTGMNYHPTGDIRPCPTEGLVEERDCLKKLVVSENTDLAPRKIVA